MSSYNILTNFTLNQQIHDLLWGKLIHKKLKKLISGVSLNKLEIAILHVKEWTMEVTGPQSTNPNKMVLIFHLGLKKVKTQDKVQVIQNSIYVIEEVDKLIFLITSNL